MTPLETRLLEMLKECVEELPGTSYDGPDDEIGARTCCYALTIEPHRDYCTVLKAKALIQEAENQ